MNESTPMLQNFMSKATKINLSTYEPSDTYRDFRSKPQPPINIIFRNNIFQKDHPLKPKHPLSTIDKNFPTSSRLDIKRGTDQSEF